MSSDVDKFMDDLDNTIAEIFSALGKGKPVTINHKKSDMGFGITANISIKIGLLESLDAPKYDRSKEEPLIDIIENKNDVRVIAIIPGIKKQDIKTSTHDGFIEIEIKHEDRIIQKKILCNAASARLMTKSLNYNNSVLEIVFSKEAINGTTI